MKKADFYTKLSDELELEEKTISEKTPFHLTSLRTLMLIAFVDENFNKRIKVVDLKDVKTIADLMNLIGIQNFTD